LHGSIICTYTLPEYYTRKALMAVFLLDVPGSREYRELATSQCRKTDCVAPTVRLLYII